MNWLWKPVPQEWLHTRIWSLQKKKTLWCQKECKALQAIAVLTTGCLRLDQIKPKINTLGDRRRNLNLAFKFWYAHTRTKTCKNCKQDPPSGPRRVLRCTAAQRPRCDQRPLCHLAQPERKTCTPKPKQTSFSPSQNYMNVALTLVASPPASWLRRAVRFP